MNDRKPGIESSLGRVNYSGNVDNSQRRVLKVDDATEEPMEQVRSFSSGNFDNGPTDQELEELAQNREKLQHARQISQQQKNKIPDGIKRRMEILTGIGRLSEDIEVDGVTFSIRSLKPKENEEIIKAIAAIDLSVVQAFELRAQTLARALYKIDNQDINLVIDSKGIEDNIKFVKDVLEESLVNYLYSKYQDILNKNKMKFNDLGKTEEEVIENVKKS